MCRNIDLMNTAEIQIIGIQIVGRLRPGTHGFGAPKARFDGSDNAIGNAVLQLENVVECALKSISPDMAARRRLDQLPGDPTRPPARRILPSRSSARPTRALPA